MRPSDSQGELNMLAAQIRNTLIAVRTATLVKVLKCTNNGGVSPVGFVDILPLVNQVDGAGVPVPHTTIFNVPYFRYQGGANAVIIDPVAGDIGIVVFADSDISIVKRNKTTSVPGSARKFCMSDGLYIGGMLNAVPTQYVQFAPDAINITSPHAVNLTAPTVTINASTSVTMNAPVFYLNGRMESTGDVKAGGISLITHKTTGVTPGLGLSGGPQ